MWQSPVTSLALALSVSPRAITGRSTGATPDIDFDDSDFTITFEQNDVEKEACVTIYDDDIEEIGLESFIVYLNSVEHRQVRQASSDLLPTIDDENQETIVFIRDDDGMSWQLLLYYL